MQDNHVLPVNCTWEEYFEHSLLKDPLPLAEATAETAATMGFEVLVAARG